MLTVLLAWSALACLPASALASHTQESTFQDDDLLIYDSPTGTARTLDTLRALGVDRVRVSVFWRLLAPNAQSRTRPAGFAASDSGAYPPGTWNRYDQLLVLAHARGIAVNFNITDPAPLWATGRPPRSDIASTYRPSAKDFGQFVTALATRYSGSYAVATAATAASTRFHPRACDPGIVGLLGNCPPPFPPPSGGSGPTSGSTPHTRTILPRVDYWSIWNEPNQAGWLTPQWARAGRGAYAETAPAVYRGLVDAAYGALLHAGHGRDTILVGDTAPEGLGGRPSPTHSLKLLSFVRNLYCLDGSYRLLRGGAATMRGCPGRPQARAFVRAHPGLFAATGWAHHPYTDKLDQPPGVAPADPQFSTIANLARLRAALARATGAYGVHRRMALYLTEFGFQTRPNPRGIPLSQQAAFLNQSEYIAYSDPSVRTLSQFLLRDATPHGRVSFQTGLEFLSGRLKPSFAAYRMPIFLPSPVVRRGGELRVWGGVRSARSPVAVSIQLAARTRGSRFHTLRVVTSNPRGYVDTHVVLHSSGAIRLAYRSPGGAVWLSRITAARVR